MLPTTPESAELDSPMVPPTFNAFPSTYSRSDDFTEQPDGPPKGSREALQEFLQWTRPAYVKALDHSKSSGTRAPAFYDLHIHPDLRLKRVVIDDGLPKLIARVCDQYFDNNHFASDLPINKKFPSDVKRKNAVRKAQDIINEASLALDYAQTTGHFCSTVASTFAFESLGRWDKVFDWGTNSERHQKHGIADGFLSLTKDEKILSRLSEEDREKISMLSRHHINEFVIWEFKSLVAGKLDVMQEIERLEGNFPWMTCHSAEDCLRHTTMGRRTVTGRKTGPDALTQAWEMQTPESLTSKPGRKRKHEDQLSCVLTTHKAKFAPNVSLPETTLESQQDLNQPDEELCGLQKKARDIVQQAWAEAVMSDATYLVISAGNLEFIGFRDRERQTLVLSPLIRVHKAIISQAKLHTGLYVCAYYDAIDRAQQLGVMLTEKPESAYLPRYRRNYDDDALKYLQTPLVKRTKSEKEAELKVIAKEIEHQLKAAKEISLRLPAAIIMSPSRGYKKFQRQSHVANKTTNNSTIRVDAHTCLGGRAWRVSVQVGDKYYPGGMVIKFARNSTEKVDLQNEYDAYCKLHSESPKPSFIIQIYGIYAATVGGTSGRPIERCGLLMAYGGASLQTRLRNINIRVFTFLSHHSKNLRDALKNLHQLQYAHRKIVPEHFVIRNDQVFLLSLAAVVKIIEPRRHGFPEYPGGRRSSSVGAIPYDDDFSDYCAGVRAQKSEERSLEEYLTKVH